MVVIISRILTLIFSIGIVILDLYYYLKVVDHPSRWVKLTYVFVYAGWIIYILTILSSKTQDVILIMSATAAPLIAFNTMSHFGGSLLRIKDIIDGRVAKRDG